MRGRYTYPKHLSGEWDFKSNASKKQMNTTVKKYLVSSLITFAVAFLAAVYPHIDSLTMEGVKSGALVAVGFVGLRTAFKAVIEHLVPSVK